MNKPTDEQIKEFWEWCGFKHDVPFPEYAKRKDISHPERFTKEQWYIPGDYCGKIPPIDLDNLFKYAVPKALKIIDERGHCPPIMKLFQLWYDELVTQTGDSSNVEQAARALFLAIYEEVKQ